MPYMQYTRGGSRILEGMGGGGGGGNILNQFPVKNNITGDIKFIVAVSSNFNTC